MGIYVFNLGYILEGGDPYCLLWFWFTIFFKTLQWNLPFSTESIMPTARYPGRALATDEVVKGLVSVLPPKILVLPEVFLQRV